jgi:NAD(P)-dependent dehydrogenase (short-subunit alcohol dehydrogenase family)
VPTISGWLKGVVRPAAPENHRNPVTASHLSGGEPEDATEGTRPSRDRSKAEIVMASLGGAGEGVAVVVGAGELGTATATLLAGAGFTVVAVDRTPKALEELPEGIRREVGDTTDQAVAKTLIDRIAAEVGPPEVLVNTIGGFLLGEAVSATPEDLRAMMDVNLGAALWLSQAVEPYMRQRGSGAIVHVSARPGTDPTAGMAAYSLSKAALSHLVRILDLELRPHGIRVNAVAPQLLDTSRNRTIFAAEVLAHAVRPEAVADIIAFLVSDRSAPVSGAIVPAYGA